MLNFHSIPDAEVQICLKNNKKFTKSVPVTLTQGQGHQIKYVLEGVQYLYHHAKYKSCKFNTNRKTVILEFLGCKI